MKGEQIIAYLEKMVAKAEDNDVAEEFVFRLSWLTASAIISAYNRQKAEIERLRAECGNQSALWSKHFEDIFETSKETIKSEAIKEFAERLCDGRVSNDPVIIAVKAELKEMGENQI